jgi:hypothetical protein
MPPANGQASTTSKVNGRTYTCAAGATIDVPDFDGDQLEANGWLKAAAGGVGSTAQRPSYGAADKGKQFHDSTLGKNIVWDGKNWRDPTNGSAI